MICFRKIALLVALLLGGWMAFGQTNTGLPPIPPLRSPVDTFRELLNLSANERTRALADRPVEARQRLLEKIREYQGLSPDECKLRLHATELRWWLLSLMRQPATNQVSQMVPEHLRALIKDRLAVWNLIPPPLQKEFLDNEDIRLLYERIQGLPQTQREKILKSLPPERQKSLQAGLEQWMEMSPDERKQTCERFEHFFSLNEPERTRVLGTLSETEQRQMAQTLKAFDMLPSEKRQICIRSFAKFASMSAGERLQFLKKAERWEKMSTGERQAWRNLVNTVTNLPPLPSDFYENTPPLPPGFVRPPPALTTNDGG
jgi:hypothetical protein